MRLSDVSLLCHIACVCVCLCVFSESGRAFVIDETGASRPISGASGCSSVFMFCSAARGNSAVTAAAAAAAVCVAGAAPAAPAFTSKHQTTDATTGRKRCVGGRTATPRTCFTLFLVVALSTGLVPIVEPTLAPPTLPLALRRAVVLLPLLPLLPVPPLPPLPPLLLLAVFRSRRRRPNPKHPLHRLRHPLHGHLQESVVARDQLLHYRRRVSLRRPPVVVVVVVLLLLLLLV